jgi:hypothetical protein
VPRQYRDLDYVIEAVLFRAIIEFVDTEKALEVVDFSPEHTEKIKEIYRWAKSAREVHEISIGFALKKWFEIKDSESWSEKDEAWRALQSLEDELEQKNTEYLKWIVENRHILWT